MHNYNFSHSELTALIDRVAKEATIKTLRELGLIKKIKTRADIEFEFNRTVFEHSKQYVKWIKKGNARNSQVYCDAEEFEAYARKFNEEFKKMNK